MQSTNLLASGDESLDSIDGDFWSYFSLPWEMVPRYLSTVGAQLPHVPYLSSISKAVGVTSKAISSGLVSDAYAQEVVSPLVLLAFQYREYEKKQRANGPRWLKTQELPKVIEIKKLARRHQALIEKQKKLIHTIKQQDERCNVLNNHLEILLNSESNDTQRNRIHLFDVIQVKRNILKQKKMEWSKVTEEIHIIEKKLQETQKQASVDIKYANNFLLNVATYIENDFRKSSVDIHLCSDLFDSLWPQPVSDDEYREFKIRLNQFLRSCGLTAEKEINTAIELLDVDKLRFFVLSRFAVLRANEQLSFEDRKERIAILVPVHKEFNRLKEVNECLTGENFLEVKCDELNWLLQSCEKIQGKIYFIDDQAPHGKPGEKIEFENESKQRISKNKDGKFVPCIRRTIDEIDELLSGRLHIYRNMCVCLGYENMEKQISEYTDEQLKTMHPDDLANKSVKAGAVHLGLRYLSDNKLADDVILTDADNSIHLATIGTLIYERVVNKKSAVIGSRRIEGSVVGNKSNDRHQMSFVFNMLNRVLINVQVPDTQVGCKLIAVDAIPGISPKMHNLTMAFDVELIRGLQEIGIEPRSIPIYWADSPEESQSSAQANNMFKGVIEIFLKLYGYGQEAKQNESKQTAKDSIRLMQFDEIFSKLLHDSAAMPALRQTLELAAHPVFHFIIEHIESIYETLTPEMYQDFINSLSICLMQLSQGQIEKKYIQKLLKDIKTLYENTTESYAVGFLLEKFPGIFSVLELLYRDPSYARVLAPLFLGDAVLAKKLAGTRLSDTQSKSEPVEMQSFIDYCKIKKESNETIDLISLFKSWGSEGKVQKKTLQQPLGSVSRRELVISEKRENTGWFKLKEKIKEEAVNKTPKKIISLVMQFDQSGGMDIAANIITAKQFHYWQDVIKGKMDALRKCLGKSGLTPEDININIIVVDARSDTARKIDTDNKTKKAICEIIQASNDDHNNMGIHCEYYDLSASCPSAIGSKATAIRQGMRHAVNDMPEPQQPDAIGFIDFSQKIRIQEMGALIAEVVGAPENTPCVVIGTRRAYESKVVGKRKEFLFRSMVCNQVVKAFLPELAHLTDTQTGFKLFPANVLKQILNTNDENAELNIISFAFDVQLLMRLVAHGCEIKELPVVFNDNTQDLVDPDLAGPAQQMFADFLIISAEEQRRKRKSVDGKSPTFSKPVFMGNGAEHVVFDCGNNMLMKIEAQHVNPNFRLILQHILFNRSRAVPDAGTTSDDLFIMQFNKLLQVGVLEQWIPLLRNIPDLNRLVLGSISAWEDKTKSIDLSEVKRRGKGLVGGFAYIEKPFSTTLDGVIYNFYPRHRSKVCIKAKGILQDTFVSELYRLQTLKDMAIHEVKRAALIEQVSDDVVVGLQHKVINPALELFEKMWSRGLFDLDTNIISDLGFFPGEDAELILQSLDPGEMITGIMNVDVVRAKDVLEKRSDILLMNAQIASIVKQLNLNQDETQGIIEKLKREVIGYYFEKMMGFFNRIAKEKEEVQKIMDLNPKLSEDEACQLSLLKINYGMNWRAIKDKSVFRMDDIHFNLDPPTLYAKSYYADQDSKLLGAAYNQPYRSNTSIPAPRSVYEDASKNNSDVILIVPEGKEESIESKLKPGMREEVLVHGIERGSIVPLMDFSEDLDKAKLSDSLEKNRVYVLDAGGGTRTATIGLQAGSKGSIKLAGASLNEHAIHTGKSIAEKLSEKGMNDSVIISSCDDLFSSDTDHINAFVDNIAAYFKGVNSPGIYWIDLPDGGKKYMPLTADDTYHFLKSDKIKNEVKNFLLHILITRGYAQQGVVDNIYACVDQIYNALLDMLNPNLDPTLNEQKTKENEEAFALLGGVPALGGILSEITARYAKLIQWHATQSRDEISGLKRPFLMVMKKSFFNDLRQIVSNHYAVLDKAKEEITWENFLLRGLKADVTIWQLFKPKNIENKEWLAIYNELQSIKIKHGIHTDDVKQNQHRALPPIWHNLDDAYALYTATKEMYGKVASITCENENQVTVISDYPDGIQAISVLNPNDYRFEMIALGSELNGVTIEPTYLKDVLVSHQYQENILLYEIALNPQNVFKPTMGHVHTQHYGCIYSSPIGPFTKDVLKSQPVYIYKKDHQECLVAKPLTRLIHGKEERVTMADFAEYLKSTVTPEMQNTVKVDYLESTLPDRSKYFTALRNMGVFREAMSANAGNKKAFISLLHKYAEEKAVGKSVETEMKVFLTSVVLPRLLTTQWSKNTMSLDAKYASSIIEKEILSILKEAGSHGAVHLDPANIKLFIHAAKMLIEASIYKFNKMGANAKYQDFEVLVLRCAGQLNDTQLKMNTR